MELEFDTNGMLEDSLYEYSGDIDAAASGNERCGICMDVIIDRGVLDCCQHWFCFTCIDNWATITNLCPLCQNEFKLITCVPVYDTIGSGKVEEDSLSRDEDWCIHGTNNTLSFPSYYIDENAVICLDGNGCKIRNGVATSGDVSILDTSIACDSCDIWYHAFCVDFDPESTSENSWLCPRCIDDVPQKTDGVSLHMQNYQYGPESVSPEHLVDGSQSGKLSVSVADAGETAVVVSMIEKKHLAKETIENSLSARDDNKNIESLDKMSNIQLYVDTAEKSLALSLSQDTYFTVPCDSLRLSELETNLADEAVFEGNISDSISFFSGLLSDKSNNESQPSESESKVDLHLGLSVGSSLSVDKTDSDTTENKKSEVSQPHRLFKDFSESADEMDHEANEDAVGSSRVKRKFMSSRDPVLVTGHTEVDNTCTRDETVADPPAKKAKGDGNSKQIHLKDEGRKSITGTGQEWSHLPGGSNDEIDNMCTRDEMIAKVHAKKSKVGGKSQRSQLTPKVKKSIAGNTQECVHTSAGSKDNKMRDVPHQEDRTATTLSIDRGSIQSSSAGVSHANAANISLLERDNGSGVRVKKIMRRVAEDESSKVFENLRKEIKEAVRNKPTNDLSKSNLFDPELLLAFRNAIAGQKPEHEPVKRLDPMAIRAKKLMLQKGKARENLTKKIYGNSNGRRKRAWDRDLEVEFWKHRCKRVTKPEKVETLKSVLGLLRKSSESSEMRNGPREEGVNPILSRLYLADTSVFPRKDDIKPVSALTGTGSMEVSKEQNVKEKVSKSVNDYQTFPTAMQISPNLSQYPKDEVACKKPYSNGSVDKQNSTSLASGSKDIHSLKKESGKSDVKSDKRKWALEVLARKTSTVQRHVTQEKEGDSTMLKGNFPLLAQLPPDMRPVLAASRHNKVPIPVRQAQLYRLTEHFLRKADLPVIRRTADTELAVADAVNIEKDVVNRSNSKLVYVNLCSQVLFQHMNNNRPDSAVEPDPSQSVVHAENIDIAANDSSDLSGEAALRMAGLVSDSPPSSPSHTDGDDNIRSMNGDRGPENVFDIDTHAELDIYGDFEYDLENEDYIGGIVPHVSKPPQAEEGESKMKVVFSTLATQRTDDSMDPKDTERLGINTEINDSPCHEWHKDIRILTSDVSREMCPPPVPLQEEIGEEPSLAECEELYGPDKEPLVDRFSDKTLTEGSISIGKKVLVENEGPRENSNCTQNSSVSKSINDGESCAENIIVNNGLPGECDSAGGVNSVNRCSVNENLRMKEKKTNKTKQSDIIHSISKKVEAYIKEHLRPLCKSGVITVEQYRWAVERTTAKIMRYHTKDTNANFLIKEGEKVKKLAEQYVEAAQTKDDS
ncbi:RING/U-box protein [Thalictrum thalictroides]|uniref:RING/U-box protein n=1 Tax=Thalictrum thalictroides TaxID=46969 RepID=A0A7J6US74_THATH|nr:RING/U-box protein [Thalictrum thalictroides]